jgi:RNA polymerase sigma-70 factor (ECF subfamily)
MISESDDCRASFSQVAIEQIDALYGYALTLTRNPTEAEDLVQETYLRAVRASVEVAPNGNLKGWLFVILRNAWLNQIRHMKNGPLFIELDGESGEAPAWLADRSHDPYVLYLRKLDREEIRQAIESLPTLQREIVVLRDIEGFSYQEIATLLGCPAGTVMSRLGRARDKLRRILGDRRTRRAANAV